MPEAAAIYAPLAGVGDAVPAGTDATSPWTWVPARRAECTGAAAAAVSGAGSGPARSEASERSWTNRIAALAQERARLGQRGALEVEDRGREHAVRAGLERLGQVLQLPAPPDAITGIETAAAARGAAADRSPSPVPSRSMDVSRISPAPSDSSRRIHATASSAVSSRPPLTITASRPFIALDVDRRDDALAPEAVGQAGDERGIAHRRGVDRHLVGARPERGAGVGHRADAAADRERDEDGLGHPAHHLQRGLPGLGAGGDVEEDQLVGAIGVVARGLLDGVAGVAQRLEVHALHHPPAGDIETGNDAPG